MLHSGLLNSPLKNLLLTSVILFCASESEANQYVEASFGFAQMNSSNDELDSNQYGPYRIYYGRSLTDGVFFEVGYLSGDNYENTSQDDFEIDSLFVNMKGVMALNRRYALFVKLGSFAYRYELQNDDGSDSRKNGLGYAASAGWEYVLDNRHILVGLEYENTKTVHMETNVIHGNVQYRF